MPKPIISITKMGLPSKIYLIGFMASGKTTLGKRLSKHLGYSFVDTDKLIEEKEGRLIADIFKESGEQYFRQIEQEVLHKITENSTNTVISTGGGMASVQANVNYMLANGRVVFLKLDLKSIKNRLKSSKTKRPLVDELSEDEFNKKIEKLYSERISFYEQADLTINALNIRSVSLQDIENQLEDR